MDAVVERLRRALVSGDFPAGGCLPPERELSAQLGVSRLTLRAALSRLEAEGLVRARQGDGVRVLELARHATLGVLASIDLTERPDLMRSFLELRRAVAVEAVALGCARATDAQLDALDRLAALQRTERDEAAYLTRDLEFSRAVLEASGSFATLLLFNALAPVYLANPKLGRALTDDRERSLGGYEATTALLRGRDPAVAREVLRGALEVADDEALATLASRRAGPSMSGRAARDVISRPRRVASPHPGAAPHPAEARGPGEGLVTARRPDRASAAAADDARAVASTPPEHRRARAPASTPGDARAPASEPEARAGLAAKGRASEPHASQERASPRRAPAKSRTTTTRRAGVVGRRPATKGVQR